MDVTNTQVYTLILGFSTTKVGAVSFNGLAELYSADNRFDHNVYRVQSETGHTGRGMMRRSRGVSGRPGA